MSQRIAYPFLVLPDNAVGFGGWMIGEPGHPLQPAGTVLENWDYAKDLEVSTLLAVDWDAASQALQLSADSLNLKVSLIAGSGTGNLPRRQQRLCEIVINRASDERHLSGVVSGRNLSGRLQVTLQVSLDSPCGDGSVLSPKARGARLWQCRHDILLEDGGDSRFPMETASFSQIFRDKPQERAPWYLHWRPSSIQGDFSACTRLYLNSDRSEVLARFVDGDESTLQAILGDVMSQMLEWMLDQEDASEILAECEEGSVGRQVQKWLDLGFPGQEIASIRALRDQNPGAFRAAILAAAEVGAYER